MSPLRRSLISLAVIVVALAAAWSAWRLEPPPPPPPGADVTPILAIAPTDVRAIVVTSWQGSLRARRTPAGWQVDEVVLGAGASAAEPGTPTPAPADVDRALDTLVADVVSMPEIDRFAPEGKPMSDFGLDPPQASVALELASGEHRTIEIGGMTVTTSALYARIVPGEDVFQVGSLIFNNLAASLFRLRTLAAPVTSGGGA